MAGAGLGAAWVGPRAVRGPAEARPRQDVTAGGASTDAARPRQDIVWAPGSGPQRALLSCPVFEAFFGGARGGGKTDGVLGEWGQHAGAYGPAAIGLMVRRVAKQLGETFERARAIFGPLGAKFVGSPETGGMRVTMPNGARLTFAHLERDEDAENYQGGSYTRVYVEEAGNFPSIAPILKMMAVLRSGAGVPCRIRLTGNPGGPGHQWIKERYIDPAPLGLKVLTDPETGRERVYIPSRVTDNRYLGADYVANLRQSGSPELVRAWLQGDWSVVAGAFFPEWGPRHVIPAAAVPEDWLRFRAFDWGSARPFSVGWWAVADGRARADAGVLGRLPRGALVHYREWYGSNGKPNTGLRLTTEEVADGIVAREAGETVSYGVADPAIFAADGGPSMAERFLRRRVVFKPADNARVSRGGAAGGWDMLRHRLRGLDGVPMLYAMETCTNWIRTLPGLQHDAQRPEDLDSEGEDHAADMGRYACMSRPWLPPVERDLPPPPVGAVRIGDFRRAEARPNGRY